MSAQACALTKPLCCELNSKPWLVVNVGSGVSMLKLDEQMTVELPLGKVLELNLYATN